MLLTLCDTKYQPPPCYFHYFPLPPFVKIERKISKKGKKLTKKKKINTSATIEDEWEIGSTLYSKNPAYFRKFDAKVWSIVLYTRCFYFQQISRIYRNPTKKKNFFNKFMYAQSLCIWDNDTKLYVIVIALYYYYKYDNIITAYNLISLF